MIYTMYENATSRELIIDVECDLNATGREIELAKRLNSIMRCCETSEIVRFCDDGEVNVERLTRRPA